jgi:hypothetical protein
MEVEAQINDTFQDFSWFSLVTTYSQRESDSCLYDIDKAKNNLNPD